MNITVARDAAVERLWAEQGARLWRSLLGYTADPDLASDCVAETFVAALEGWDAIEHPDAWIWRVAFRSATKELRRRRRRASVPSTGERRDEPDERALDVALALRKLPTRQRAVIVLHYYAGYTTEEIGDLLGMSGSTAGVHLHRGRARLRELLGDPEGDDDD